MTDLTIAASKPLEPDSTPSSAADLDALDDTPDVPDGPAYDYGGNTQEVPVDYVSDADLLAWLQAKSSGQYGDLDRLMDASNARSKLVKDLAHLKEALDTMAANPEAALAEIQAMRAAYAGTDQAAEVEALLAPFATPLENYVNAVASVNALEANSAKAEQMKAEMKAQLTSILPKTGSIDAAIKNIEHDDQIALVQIQALMSEIRETAQLTSNIIGNRSQTSDSIVGNIRA
jgi:predicted  nucleic acid-binding Zn-ribbon protein